MYETILHPRACVTFSSHNGDVGNWQHVGCLAWNAEACAFSVVNADGVIPYYNILANAAMGTVSGGRHRSAVHKVMKR